MDDGDASVRAATAQALWSIGDVRAIGSLVRALADESYDVRRAAVRGLEKFGDLNTIPALEEMKRHETSRGKMDLRPVVDQAIVAIRSRA